MARIIDEKQNTNLKKHNIEIKTKYLDNEKYTIKSTNEENSEKYNITNGIILEKIYLKENKPLQKLTNFDSRVQYKFITNFDMKENVSCPNCNYTGKGTDFIDGCPYCKTYFNIDYKDKELGTKHYYDLATKSDKYAKTTFIVDLIFCLIVMFIYIKITGRTFNVYDIGKVLIGGVLLGLIFYFVFYLLDAVIITIPLRISKEKQNTKEKEFFDKMSTLNITKNKLLNSFNYELRNKLYENKDIIDYDIIDYNSFSDETINSELLVNINISIRIVKCINNKIEVKVEDKEYKMVRKNITTTKLEDGVNIIKCPSCGASIDAMSDNCSYCHNKINKLQEWFIVTK